MRIRLALIAAAALVLVGCKKNVGDAAQPHEEVFVLVDLSETWHNDHTDSRNETLLSEIGQGISLSADTVQPPVAVQYRVIGAASLDREPVCDVLYQPSMIAVKGRRPDYLVKKIAELKSYLGTDCPAVIVRQPPEKLTQISAAIDSVSQVPRIPKTPRFLIIASDFYEETGGALAPLSDLTGTKVLLIYRPVSQDHSDPLRLITRMDAWKARLQQRGAEVVQMPDVGLKRAAVSGFLNQ